MIEEKEKLIHWNYFLAIEADTEGVSRFIEFTETNFQTYSIELARLILAAASEVDVVAKLLCKKVNPNDLSRSIGSYHRVLTNPFPTIKKMKILIRRYGLELKPWVDWTAILPPNWWSDYNKVKHERNAYFHRASLKNALNAVAALFIMVLHYYKEEAEAGTLSPMPTFFDVAKEHRDYLHLPSVKYRL